MSSSALMSAAPCAAGFCERPLQADAIRCSRYAQRNAHRSLGMSVFRPRRSRVGSVPCEPVHVQAVDLADVVGEGVGGYHGSEQLYEMTESALYVEAVLLLGAGREAGQRRAGRVGDAVQAVRL
jgi:hypothetical protein